LTAIGSVLVLTAIGSILPFLGPARPPWNDIKRALASP
jgi:hypothetical protein